MNWLFSIGIPTQVTYVEQALKISKQYAALKTEVTERIPLQWLMTVWNLKPLKWKIVNIIT